MRRDLGATGPSTSARSTRVVADAADPAMTPVGDVYSPVVENGRLVGIVAQADVALSEKEKRTGELVEATSEPSEGERR